MAVSAFRALAAAHFQGSISQTRRQFGTTGFWVLVILAVLLVVFGLLPLLPIAFGVGFFTGRGLSSPKSEWVASIGAVVSTAIVVFGGLINGISGSTRQLPWETLKAFPIGRRTLFITEFLASTLDVLTGMTVLLFGLATLGLSVGSPRAAPFFFILGSTHCISLLAAQHLIGGLFQRLTKSAKALLIVLPFVAFAMSVLPAALFKDTSRQRGTAVLEQLATLGHWAPAGRLFQSALHAINGHLTLDDVYSVLLNMLLAMLALVLAYWFVVTERPPETIDTSSGSRRLWSFRHPVFGVARLQFQMLMKSTAGQFGFFVPVATIILIRGPLSRVFADSSFATPAAFAYAALAGTNLLFNQFGLDRHGVKVLLLLPLSSETLLKGKWLGFAGWQATQLALLVVLSVLSGQRAVQPLLLGAMVYLLVFLIESIIGQFSSIWQPRPIQASGMRGARPPLLVSLVVLATVSGTGGLIASVLLLTGWLAPGFESLFFALLLLPLSGILLSAFKVSALLLDRNREKLGETLAGNA